MSQRGRQDGNGRQQTPNYQQGGTHGHQQQYHNQDLLLPNEEVLIDARPAWSAWTGTLVVAALILIASLFTGESAAVGLGVVISLALVGYVWYQRRKVRYLVTNARVMVVTGITSRKTNEAWLEDVKGMQTGASFIERLLGHGHILISREILPRGSFLIGHLRGQGMKLGGIGNYEEVAQVVRQRQVERKGPSVAQHD